jgi:DNA repair protein RadC
MSPTDKLSLAVPAHDRPRERLMRVGAGALTDAEILALVLGSGSSGQNVVSWSAAVLRDADGFAGLLSMDAGRLQQVRGIGPATAGRLAAVAEMWRRANGVERTSRLSDSASIADVVLAQLAHRPIEQFVVIVAGRDLRVREVVALRDGSEHAVHVDSREVLSAVLSRGGVAFAVAHNHPGGAAEPSNSDVVLTNALREAAEAVGLRFLDHILVAGADWRSIR